MSTNPHTLARTTDPETSHAAAASLSKTEQVRAALYYLLAALGPLTDEDLALAYSMGLAKADGITSPTASPSSMRTRRAELVSEGKVVDSGKRQALKSGRRGIVWAVVA